MKALYKHSVFIVDDDPDDRESIRDAFLENKHEEEFIFLQDGDQLLERLQVSEAKNKNAIVLLDLNMPGRNGREVLKDLKGNDDWKTIPVIILTTSSSEKDRFISYKLGANCFITKPNTYREMMSVTDCIARLWFFPYSGNITSFQLLP